MDQGIFRQVLGAFPSGVCIVTAMDRDERCYGFTCSALCSVSIDPPSLLICVDKQSETLAAIQSQGAFVVNILAAGQEDISRRFASKSRDKFVGLPWRPASGAAGAPVLDHVAGHAECQVAQAIEAGDHHIFIAEVVHGESHEEREPLIYWRKSYRCVATNSAPVPPGETEVMNLHPPRHP